MRLIQECASTSGWQDIPVMASSGNDEYTVILPPWDRVEEEAVCECPGYVFRGRCRHQREAMSIACSWSELDSEEQTDDEKEHHVCPDCGGRTQIVVIGDKW